jgi:hypothetical protein
MHHPRFAPLPTLVLSTILATQSAPLPLVGQPLVAKSMIAKSVAAGDLSRPDPAKQAKLKESYGKLPLSFEANQGQADARVKFVSRTPAYSLFLTGDEAVMALHGAKGVVEPRPAASPAASTSGAVPTSQPTSGRATESILRMKLRNANTASNITGVDELPGTSNYFIGNDQGKWHTSIPTYAKVKYEGIYSGIDLVYYGNQHQLEYDFIVAPGADPRRIGFDVTGAKSIRRNAQGELVFQMKSGSNNSNDEIRWHKPLVYQEKEGARQLIAASYSISAANGVGFDVGRYDASRPLYIDPLIYSSYLGGSGFDWGAGIAVDSAGNAYVTGWTSSIDFPTKNPLQPSNGGGANGYDAFVSKINAAGSELIYSTYLGGNEDDEGQGIAVDSAGNAYVTGTTSSANFPITAGAFQTVCNGGSNCYPFGDGFVAKLDPSGSSLVYSTYLGGSFEDFCTGIAVDTSGNAYIIGTTGSLDFPTKNALQPSSGGNGDSFVAKLNPAGSALVYSSYLGGSNQDWGVGISVDSAGKAHVIGYTKSLDFPVKNPIQPTNHGVYNAFVAEINGTGEALVYSTYLGGNGSDFGSGIAVDRMGNTYVTGTTGSPDFPVTSNAFQKIYGGGQDAFISKINVAGTALVYSTYLGGKNKDNGQGIALDSTGNAYVIGSTGSYNFPLANSLIKVRPSPFTVFVSRLNPAGTALVYSTFLGGSVGELGLGIAVDNAGNAYVTGVTQSTDFPTKTPLQPAYGGDTDAFVSKLFIAAATTTKLSSAPNPSAYGQAVTFAAVVSSGLGAPPDGETVTFKKGATVLGTGTLSGGTATFMTSTLGVGSPAVTAVYGGDPNFGGSTSKAVKQVVNKATTTTALSSSQNPSNLGQSVTFTASVAPQFSGTVTGTVTFYDGTTALKTLSVSGGVAKFTTSTLTHGMHSITATHNGNSNLDASSSEALTQTVN